MSSEHPSIAVVQDFTRRLETIAQQLAALQADFEAAPVWPDHNYGDNLSILRSYAKVMGHFRDDSLLMAFIDWTERLAEAWRAGAGGTPG